MFITVIILKITTITSITDNSRGPVTINIEVSRRPKGHPDAVRVLEVSAHLYITHIHRQVDNLMERFVCLAGTVAA